MLRSHSYARLYNLQSGSVTGGSRFHSSIIEVTTFRDCEVELLAGLKSEGTLQVVNSLLQHDTTTESTADISRTLKKVDPIKIINCAVPFFGVGVLSLNKISLTYVQFVQIGVDILVIFIYNSVLSRLLLARYNNLYVLLQVCSDSDETSAT